jgi:hypothetical protein
MALEYDGEAPGQISCRSTRPRAGRSIRGRGRRLRRPPVFYLARAIQAETTCGESPFTQTIRIALAAFCQCYNSGGNHRLHGLIRAPEAVNVFYGSVVSVRHHRNVRLFKYGIADKWNYRRHSFPPIWLRPNMASPRFGAIGLEDSPHCDASLFKIDHIWRPARVRLRSQKRTSQSAGANGLPELSRHFSCLPEHG